MSAIWSGGCRRARTLIEKSDEGGNNDGRGLKTLDDVVRKICER